MSVALDGERRTDVTSIAHGRIDIRVFGGRVEIGQAAGDQVRVRWTVPAFREPRYRLGPRGLHIRAWRTRLRVDLPAGLTVRVRLRRGQITSWGAGGDLTLLAGAGTVSCRELRIRVATVRARRVNLHFAITPERVDVVAHRTVLALPGGPYVVTAPAGAEVTVPRKAGGPEDAPRIMVRARHVRILAAVDPVRLTGESGGGG